MAKLNPSFWRFAIPTLVLIPGAAFTSCEEASKVLGSGDDQEEIKESQKVARAANNIDWKTSNEPVTKKLDAKTATVPRTISRKDFFQLVKAPELGQDTPDKDIELAYVPVVEVGCAEPNLPSPAIVVFVGKIDWLFALHCGLYIREPEGEGHLYHASSKTGEVVAVKLADYLEGTDRYLGFTAYAVNAPE